MRVTGISQGIRVLLRTGAAGFEAIPFLRADRFKHCFEPRGKTFLTRAPKSFVFTRNDMTAVLANLAAVLQQPHSFQLVA
jgi:hypothetical protein